MAFFDILCSFLSQGVTSNASPFGGSRSGSLGSIVNAGINALNRKTGSRGRSGGVGGLLGGLVGGLGASQIGNANPQQNFSQNQMNSQYQQEQYNQQYQQQNQYQQQQNFQDQQYGQPQQRQFDNVFGTQQNINDFLLLIVKIGVYVARCDQNFIADEKYKIDDYVARLDGISSISQTVKNQIQNIYNQSISFDTISIEMNALLSNYQSPQDKAEIKGYVNEFIDDITSADCNVSSQENEFVNAWRSRFA